MSNDGDTRPCAMLDLGYVQDGKSVDRDIHRMILPAEEYMPETHHFLLRFLRADLESVEEQIRDAFEERSYDDLVKAADSLSACHPYFEFASTAWSYVSGSIACLVWQRSDISDAPLLLEELGIYDPSYYAPAVWNRPGKGSVGTLIRKQHSLLKLVVFLLSDNNEDLERLPMTIREGLYGLSCREYTDGGWSYPSLAKQEADVVLPAIGRYEKDRDRMDSDREYASKIIAATEEILSDKEDGLPDVYKDILDRSTSYDEEEYAPYIYMQYDARYLEDILDLEIRDMLLSGVRVRKCRRCGDYFPVSSVSKEYCQAPKVDGSSTCYKIMCDEALKARVQKEYRKAYKTHHERVRSGHETQEEFKQWQKDAKALQSHVYDETFFIEDYAMLLKKPAKELHELAKHGILKI